MAFRSTFGRVLVLVGLVWSATLPASGQVPAGWTAVDIGAPAAPGLTAVDASAVWSIRGSGADVFGNADQFHFCYRPFLGSGSISARILSQEGGDPTWAKTGLMIRENESPGARNFNFVMTSGAAGHATFRPAPRQGSGSLGGFLFPRAFPLYLRLQRSGNEFTGFWSEDGVLWRQATRSLNLVMPAQALAGLSATSHEDGAMVFSTFDRVEVRPGVVSVRDLTACGSDRSVLLTWTGHFDAFGYHVYRVASDGIAHQFARLTASPIPGTSFTDSAPGLQNGVRVLYAVTPVLVRQPSGERFEGPMVATTGTPIDVPGFFGCGIQEGVYPGAAARDPATDTILLRGSGDDIFYDQDQGYLVARRFLDDVQVTAKVNQLPVAPNGEAKAGIMLRESTEPNARNAFFWVSPTNGARFQYRRDFGGGTARGFALSAADLKLPIWLRVTKRGQFVNAETSSDGVTYRNLGSVRFNPPLSDSLLVGLAITSRDRNALAEARFQNLTITTAP